MIQRETANTADPTSIMDELRRLGNQYLDFDVRSGEAIGTDPRRTEIMACREEIARNVVEYVRMRPLTDVHALMHSILRGADIGWLVNCVVRQLAAKPAVASDADGVMLWRRQFGASAHEVL